MVYRDTWCMESYPTQNAKLRVIVSRTSTCLRRDRRVGSVDRIYCCITVGGKPTYCSIREAARFLA